MNLFNTIPEESLVQSTFVPEVMAYNTGYRVIVGNPGVGKTTYALWSMRQLLKRKLIDTFVYVDFDSKDYHQMTEISKQASKEGWYHLKALDSKVMARLTTPEAVLDYALNNIPNNSGVLIDTWNKLHTDEDNNSKGSKIATAIKEKAVSKNLLITILGHFGKDTSKGLRGGSSIIGDVGYVTHMHQDKNNTVQMVVKKDSLGKIGQNTQRELTIDYTSEIISDVDIKITENCDELEKELSLLEMRELKLNKQRKFLTAYIAAIVSDTLYSPMTSTKLRDFVLRNINRLEDGSKKSQDNEDYCSTKLIREEYANLLDTTFEVTLAKVEGSKKPMKLVDKISADDFLLEHKEIKGLPTVYDSIIKGDK